jgi:hypothetical protein
VGENLQMEPLHVALLLLTALCLVLGVAWRLSLTATGRANRTRQRHAQRGEERAERLLASRGYRVVDRQVSGSWTLSVDGEPVVAAVRADLLVSRRGRTYVAEVKTGRRGTDPSFPATRRQLLEYALIFQPDGVLLVDVDARQVRQVDFPGVS